MRKGYSYLRGNKWADITREERFFCLVAYNYFADNPNEAVKWINQKCELGLDDRTIDKQNWEVGFEVALYRDYIHDEGTGFINEADRFRKRTFDLCLFSEAYLIIVEAKAYSGFKSEQLEDIKRDKEDIIDRILKKNSSLTEIILVALISSHYSPRSIKFKETFDGKPLTWKNMHKKYEEKKFLRADEIYSHSPQKCEVCKNEINKY